MTRPVATIIAGIAGLAIAVTTTLVASPRAAGWVSTQFGFKLAAAPAAQAVGIDGVGDMSLPKAAVPVLAQASVSNKLAAKQDEAVKRKASRHTRRYARVRRPNVAPTSKT